MKLLEEEEKEKREEEERKERRRTKEREKKLRRKERLREKEKDREKKCSETNQPAVVADASKLELTANADEELNAIDDEDVSGETGEGILSGSQSPDEVQDEQLLDGFVPSDVQNFSDSPDGDCLNGNDDAPAFAIDHLKYSRRKLKFRKDFQEDACQKWSDRRRYAGSSEHGNMVSNYEPRHHVDNFDTSRSINGLNKQLRNNASKCNVRNAGLKFGEKFTCSNDRINDRYESHACSCSQHNDYRAKMEPHTPRVVRDSKFVGKSESVSDVTRPYYRVNHNQAEYVRENPGRSKHKITNASSGAIRDTTVTKKVWEPMDLKKKYTRSNSDSDVTLRFSASKSDATESDQVPESSIASSSDEVTGISSQNHQEDKDLLEARRCSPENEGASQDSFHLKEKCLQYKEATDEDNEMCSASRILHGTLDLSMSTSSNSDNCSSCLSEGDSNTSSSNPQNTESSSSSDSEDTSQNSEGRETSVCLKNGFTVHQEDKMEERQSSEEVEHVKGQIADSAGAKVWENFPSKIAHIVDNGRATVNVGAQPQVVIPPLHNQGIRLPIFQAPPMGYYHHTPVSWPAAPANGYMPFPHPNHYMIAGPFGYSLNGNPHFMQYGTLQHLNPPVLNHSHLPAFQPVTQNNCLNVKEQVKISKPGMLNEPNSDANVGRVVSTGQQRVEMSAKAEAGKNGKSDQGDAGNTGFSLFHFGGPVALSTGFKSDPVPLKEETGEDISMKLSADRTEGDQACNRKNSIEEYNLFAASNGIKFSFF